jgi:hypothetical protein
MQNEYQYVCPHCQSECSIELQYTGLNISCPSCSQEFFATAPDLSAQVALPEKIPFLKSGKKKLLKQRLEHLVSDGDLSAEDDHLLAQTAAQLKLSAKDYEDLKEELFLDEFSSIKKEIERTTHITDKDLEAIEKLKGKYGVNKFDLGGDALMFRAIYFAEVKGLLPNPTECSLMLNNNEDCFFELNTGWVQACIQNKGYTGASFSMPTGIKGLRFKIGNYQPIKSDELTLLDEGVLVVTNKALRFVGSQRSQSISYSKITNLTIYSNCLKIDKSAGKPDFFQMNAVQSKLISAIVELIKNKF